MYNDSVMEAHVQKWDIPKNVSPLTSVVSIENISKELQMLRSKLKRESQILKNQRDIITRTEKKVDQIINQKWGLERRLIQVEHIASQPTPRRFKKKNALENLIKMAKAGKLLNLIPEEV